MVDKDNLKDKKKKFIRFDVIILIILIVAAGIIVSYFIRDSSVVGQCNTNDDCGAYNVFYMKGTGYVCANKIIVQDSSIKTRVLMFKYASKKATPEQPTACSCIQNQCEAN